MGIAIQNERLYASLEKKASELRTRKDFNENIVESLSVGVLAVGPGRSHQSGNSQMK